jgi:hypothetical protein
MTSSVDTVPARWRALEIGDRQALAKAQTLTFNIVQWLARMANSYVADRAPEDRVLLEFRGADAAFVTKTLKNGQALEMRLPSLEMQFLENGQPNPHILDPEEHSPAEAEAWLLVEMLHRGIDRSKFSKKLPYSVPDLMSGDADDYSPLECQQGLAQLAVWFQNAAAVLEAAAGSKAKIVCSPQTLSLYSASKPEFGFSPGDAQSAEPHFYKRASNGAAGGKRSILTASKLMTEADPAAAAVRFLTGAAN